MPPYPIATSLLRAAGLRPEAPVRLQTAHPLATALVYALLDPIGGFDAVSGTGPSSRFGTRLTGASPVGAIRGFGATLGAGTSDRIVTQLTGQAVQRTWAVWAYRNGVGGGGSGRLVTAETNTVELLTYDIATARFAYIRGFTTVDPKWSISFPTGALRLLSISYDASSTANNPVFYLDGLPVAETQDVAPSGTADTHTVAYDIGNRPAGDRHWDGLIGPVLCWNRLLNPGEHWSLFDPQTRWDLWERPTTRVWFHIPAIAGITVRTRIVQQAVNRAATY